MGLSTNNPIQELSILSLKPKNIRESMSLDNDVSTATLAVQQTIRVHSLWQDFETSRSLQIIHEHKILAPIYIFDVSI